MGLKHKIIILCLIFLLPIPTFTAKFNNNDEDSVIIEANSDDKASKRDNRQIILQDATLQPQIPFYVSPAINTIPLTTTGHCLTIKGILGKCVPFRQCYPYFKVPELNNNFDNWLLGMYDTCNYFTAQGRQMFGVCCTSPMNPSDLDVSSTEIPKIESEDTQTSEQVSVTDNGVVPYYPQISISNWPPPLPTHPPHHTIPPLPTHPSLPGFPTTVKPTAWPPTNKPSKPTYQTTRPPLFTTKPTIHTTNKPIADNPSTSSCGAKNGYQDQERIVGGHNADVGEWPWIAALFNGGRQFCGGSLIDNIHILSAAHCVAHMSSWDVARLTVRLGDHNIKTNTEVRHIEKRVKRVVRHRGFDARTLYNDISIITLDTPVQFSQQIRPICLPSGSSDFAGQTGTVIGWGSLRESGPQPSILQEVNIPIWSNRECKLKYGPAAPGGIVEHMLCAGQAARDSCSGDSGGPLMVNNGKWTQVGIVSWGIGCGKGQYPGVYTRVEKFLPWINKNLK